MSSKSVAISVYLSAAAAENIKCVYPCARRAKSAGSECVWLSARPHQANNQKAISFCCATSAGGRVNLCGAASTHPQGAARAFQKRVLCTRPPAVLPFSRSRRLQIRPLRSVICCRQSDSRPPSSLSVNTIRSSQTHTQILRSHARTQNTDPTRAKLVFANSWTALWAAESGNCFSNSSYVTSPNGKFDFKNSTIKSFKSHQEIIICWVFLVLKIN